MEKRYLHLYLAQQIITEILCTEDKENLSRRDTMYLAVPAKSKGVSIEGDWNPLGMRGTVSRNLIFKDVFVPDDAALMPKGIYFEAAIRWPHMFTTLTPSYMGIAQAAYDFTIKYLRGEVKRHRTCQTENVSYQTTRCRGNAHNVGTNKSYLVSNVK